MSVVYDRSGVTKAVAESNASIEAIRLEASQALASDEASVSQRARVGELCERLASDLKRAEGLVARLAGSQGVQLLNDFTNENGMGDGRTIQGTHWEETRLHDEAAAYFRAAIARRQTIKQLRADNNQNGSNENAH